MEVTPDKYLDNVAATSPGRNILEKPRVYEADFSYKEPEKEEGDEPIVGSKRLLRKYFTPTEPNWGPKARATGGKKAKTDDAAAAEDETK